MNSNPLTRKVNTFISMFFVASFGLFMTVIVVRTIHTDAPYLGYMQLMD